MEPLHAKIDRLVGMLRSQADCRNFKEAVLSARRDVLGEDAKRQKISLHQAVDNLLSSMVDPIKHALDQSVVAMLEDVCGGSGWCDEIAVEDKLRKLTSRLELDASSEQEGPADFAERCRQQIGESVVPLMQKMQAIQYHLEGDVSRPLHFLKEAAAAMSLEISSKTLHQVADEICAELGEEVVSSHLGEPPQSCKLLAPTGGQSTQTASQRSLGVCSTLQHELSGPMSAAGGRKEGGVLDSRSSTPTESAILDLGQLAKLVEQAQPAVQQVLRRLVLLFVGVTGAGKTTLIYHCAGKRLVPRIHESTRGIKHRVYEPEDGNDLDGFVLGHSSSRSGTRTMTAWTPDSGVVYLDSPGHLDTRGEEVDIATSVSLRRVAESCAGMRCVLVLRCDLFDGPDKCNTLRGICRSVATSLMDLDSDGKALCFVFSRVQRLSCYELCCELDVEQRREMAKDELHKRVLDLLENVEAHDSARQVLSIMAKELGHESSNTVIFHPEWLSPEECRAALESDQGDQWLADPGKGLQCKLTPHQEGMLAAQFKRRQLMLEKLIEEADYDQLEQCMRELQGIAGFISDLPDLSMGLEQAQSLVYKHLDFVADLVQAKIEAGTADDNRPFTVTQAQNVLQTAKVIGRLASLVMPDGQQQEDAVRNDVLKGLQSLLGLVQDMFGRDVGESVPLAVQEFLRRLSKLSVWKAAHVDFGMPYDTACSVANNSFAAVACLVEDSQVGADLLMKLRAALHLQHLRKHSQQLCDAEFLLERSLLEDEVLATTCFDHLKASLSGVSEKGLQSFSRFVSMKAADPDAEHALSDLHSAFGVISQARQEVCRWPGDTDISAWISEAWAHLIEASDATSIFQQAASCLSDSQMVPLELSFWRLSALQRSLPLEINENTGFGDNYSSLLQEACKRMVDCRIRFSEIFDQLMEQKQIYASGPALCEKVVLSGLCLALFPCLSEDAMWVQHHVQVCKLRGLKSLLVDGLWLDKYSEDSRGRK